MIAFENSFLPSLKWIGFTVTWSPNCLAAWDCQRKHPPRPPQEKKKQKDIRTELVSLVDGKWKHFFFRFVLWNIRPMHSKVRSSAAHGHCNRPGVVSLIWWSKRQLERKMPHVYRHDSPGKEPWLDGEHDVSGWLVQHDDRRVDESQDMKRRKLPHVLYMDWFSRVDERIEDIKEDVLDVLLGTAHVR